MTRGRGLGPLDHNLVAVTDLINSYTFDYELMMMGVMQLV